MPNNYRLHCFMLRWHHDLGVLWRQYYLAHYIEKLVRCNLK